MADRLISADKLKAHYAWWEGGTREMTMGEAKKDFDTIIDLQPAIEAETRWIPLTGRPMTDEECEEREVYLGRKLRQGESYVYDCRLPESEQEVLITDHYGYVATDIFINDGDYIYFENRDVDEVVAWMPMPEPYREESDNE